MAILYCYRKLFKSKEIESTTVEVRETNKTYKPIKDEIPYTHGASIYKAGLPKIENRFNSQIIIAEKPLSIDELITIMLKDPIEKLKNAKNEVDKWNKNIDNIVKCQFKTEET